MSHDCGHDRPAMNEAKILDVIKRVLRITTGAKLTIGECSQVHMHCLANLCLEAANGDVEEAAKILRASFANAIEHLESPGFKAVLVVKNGRDIPRH